MPTFSSALEAPLLRDLVTDHGRAKVILAMRLAMSQTMDMMSLQQPPMPTGGAPGWIEVFCEDFMAKYNTESLDDFALFLQMFRRGELKEPGKPQLYAGRIDGMIMFELWQRYLGMKIEAREGMHEMRKATAYVDLAEVANKNPGLRKLAENLTREAQEKRQQELRESYLAQERHRIEGVKEACEATTKAEMIHVLNCYPYQAVRNMIRNRCADLGIEPIIPAE